MTRRPFGGYILASIGVLVLLLEVVLHTVSYYSVREYEINHVILFIGIVLGFVGFYMINPAQAKEGIGILVTSGVELAKALPRFGRRSTDAVAVPMTKTEVTAVSMVDPTSAGPVTPPKPDEGG